VPEWRPYSRVSISAMYLIGARKMQLSTIS
jgi:hypothetical protein